MNEIRLLEAIKKIKEKIDQIETNQKLISKNPPKDGVNGQDGKDGIGIEKVEIDDDGHLIITLSNKEEIDCGLVKGKDGKDGKNGKDGLAVKPIIGIGIDNVKIEDKHLIVTLTDGRKIDAGIINSGSGEGEIDPIFTASSAYKIKDSDITKWNNKSDFSGIYKDLKELPTIPSSTNELKNNSGFITIDSVPTKTSQIDNDTNYVSDANYVHTDYNFNSTYKSKVDTNAQNIANITNTLPDKYDKTGGEISGDVKIDGNLTLDIEDEDYDAGIRLVQKLDDNLGTTLSFVGYANGQEATNYKTVLRNIANPSNNYDAANKQYVDKLVSTVWIAGFDNEDGTILVSSNAYDSCYEAITSNVQCYLKLTSTDKINIYKLKKWENYNEHKQGKDAFLFVEVEDIDSNGVITITKTSATLESKELEHKENKVIEWSETPNDTNYPSEKLTKDSLDALKEYIDDQYGAHVLYETDGTTGLLALNDDSAGNWQLEDLDMTPYRRIKAYVKMGSDTLSGYMNRLTPPVIVEILLDQECTDTRYGEGAFAGSGVGLNPQNRNMWFITMCVIDSTKTKFKSTQQISLYGTAVTARNDGGRFIYKIEGYKN